MLSDLGGIRRVPEIDRRVGPGRLIVIGELDVVGRAAQGCEGVAETTDWGTGIDKLNAQPNKIWADVTDHAAHC